MRFDFLPQYCGSLIGSRGLGMALLAAAMPGPVRAEDLETAIRDAVNYSPLLTSARSRVDGCSAELTIARAEGLPTVDGSLRYSKELAQGSQASDGIAVGATVNVPLFRGGSVRNAVKATESQCDASSASIGEVEDEVALTLSKAYADVLANRKIVALNQNALKSLSTMLDGVRQRLQARDLTRTDLDQAQSRVSLARGRLEASLSALESSEVEFERLTGRRPGKLAPFPAVSGIPLTPDAAVEIAISENPGIIAARSEAQSTKFSLNSAKGDLLPQVFATAGSTYAEKPQTLSGTGGLGLGTTVGIGMRMSLFAGGRHGAKVRAASARVTQAEQQVLNLERSVSARTKAAYAEWLATRTLVEASQQAVKTNESALDGVRMENAVGTRTILEILNAEQELQDAQIQLANAEKDHAIASMSILAAMGKARPGKAELIAQEIPVLAPVAPPVAQAGTGSELAKPSVSPKRSMGIPVAVTAPGPAASGTGRSAEDVPAARKLSPEIWAVQIGAFESARAARSQWETIRTSFARNAAGPDKFEPAIFRIEANGRALFRLAAIGPREWDQAQASCKALKEAGQGCLVKRANMLGELVWSATQAQSK